MTDLQSLYCDVQLTEICNRHPWKEGMIRLCSNEKNRIYYAVYYNSSGYTCPVKNYRVHPNVHISVIPSVPRNAEINGHLNIEIKGRIYVNLKRNSNTSPGSICRLAELFLDITQGKRIFATVPRNPQLPLASKREMASLNKDAVHPTIEKEPLVQTPKKDCIQPAMDKVSVVQNPNKQVILSRKGSDHPDGKEEPMAYTPKKDCVRSALGNVEVLHNPKKPLILLNKDKEQTTVQTPKKNCVQPATNPNEPLLRRGSVDRSVDRDVVRFHPPRSSTMSRAELEAIMKNDLFFDEPDCPTKENFLGEAENAENSKPVVTKFHSLSELTDQDFMKTVGASYLPESPQQQREAKKPVSVTNFYSETKSCSRFPLSDISTNSMHERQKKRSLHNAVPSTRKRLRAVLDIPEERKSENDSPVRETPKKRVWSYLNDVDIEPKECKSSEEVGFANVGNSCYMNCALQCLLHITCFTEDLKTAYSIIEDKLPELSITRCLMSLMSAVQNQKRVRSCILEDMLKTVCKVSPWFKEREQHDAQEFLCQLMSRLDEESEQHSGSDKARCLSILNNFQFQLRSSYACLQCGEHSMGKEDLDMLSVDIPSLDARHSTLQTSLEKYFSPQRIEFTCAACGSTTARCQQEFTTVPRVLIIHLKRYSYAQHSKKLDRPVKVPIFLTLKDYTEEGITVDIPRRKIHEDLNTSQIIKSPRIEVNEPSPLNSKINNITIRPQRKFKLNVHSSPFSMRGGLDDLSLTGDGDDKEQAENNVDGMSEEEQLEKALALSRMDFESQEDKELREVVNRSLLEMTSCETPAEDDCENFQDSQNEDLENVSWPHNYQLVSVINHKGRTADSGHYICDIYNHQKSSWLSFNDEHVTPTTVNDVLENCKRSGYLFFYVSRDILNAP